MCPASAIGPPKPNVPNRKKYPTKRTSETSTSSGVAVLSETASLIMSCSGACLGNRSAYYGERYMHMHLTICYAYNTPAFIAANYARPSEDVFCDVIRRRICAI